MFFKSVPEKVAYLKGLGTDLKIIFLFKKRKKELFRVRENKNYGSINKYGLPCKQSWSGPGTCPAAPPPRISWSPQ